MKNRISVLLDCIQENYSTLINNLVFENITISELENAIQILRDKYNNIIPTDIKSLKSESDMKDADETVAIESCNDTLSVNDDKNDDSSASNEEDNEDEDPKEEKVISNHYNRHKESNSNYF